MLVYFLIVDVREKGFACTSCKREKQQPQNQHVCCIKILRPGNPCGEMRRQKMLLNFFVLTSLLCKDCWVLKSLLDQLKSDSEL